MIRKCKYCGNEFNTKKNVRCCCKCSALVDLRPGFVKVRDDLREMLGLERMGFVNADEVR